MWFYLLCCSLHARGSQRPLDRAPCRAPARCLVLLAQRMASLLLYPASSHLGCERERVTFAMAHEQLLPLARRLAAEPCAAWLCRYVLAMAGKEWEYCCDFWREIDTQASEFPSTLFFPKTRCLSSTQGSTGCVKVGSREFWCSASIAYFSSILNGME